jgi:RimJ/RimL family protein N-acetyltransferase
MAGRTEAIHNITLDRVELQIIAPDDAPDLLRLYRNPNVSRYLPIKPDTQSEIEEIIARYRESWTTNRLGIWSIRLRGTMAMVGRCGFFFHAEARPPVAYYELAYMFDDRVWGRGLATECASACLRYGFESKGFDAAYAITRFENIASRRVAAKLGMRNAPVEQFEARGEAFYSVAREDFHPLPGGYELTEAD